MARPTEDTQVVRYMGRPTKGKITPTTGVPHYKLFLPLGPRGASHVANLRMHARCMQDAKTRGLLQPANVKGACTSKRDAKNKVMKGKGTTAFSSQRCPWCMHLPNAPCEEESCTSKVMRCGGIFKSPGLET